MEERRIYPGLVLKPLELTSVASRRVGIPDERRLVHLQFRRFAGCPICHLHLRSFVRRHSELEAASIREVVVFHSAKQDLLPYAGQFPFDLVADPDKRVYAEFGVESAARALLDPRAWTSILRGVIRSLGAIVRKKEAIPTLHPKVGAGGCRLIF